jgi:AraC-like DNA-binding protein
MYEFFHYLPVDDKLIQSGLYLTAVGRGVIPPENAYPPLGHPNLYSFNFKRGRILPEFQIILITEGSGVLQTKETGLIPLSPNTLIFLFPDRWHSYKPDPATGWHERWMSFNGTVPHHLMDEGCLSPDKPFYHLSDPTELISLFDNFLNNIHERPAENTLLTSLKTGALISQIMNLTDISVSKLPPAFNHNAIHSNDPLVSSALDLIWTHSHRQISTTYILDQLPTSRRTLERRFSKTCGHSIHDEIVLCRLSRAKRLLTETHLAIKKIAFLSGFGSSERMRCLFVKIIGKSPSEFRKEYAQYRSHL